MLNSCSVKSKTGYSLLMQKKKKEREKYFSDIFFLFQKVS